MATFKKYKETDMSVSDADMIGFLTKDYKRRSGRPAIYSDDEKGLEEFKDKCVEFFNELSVYNADREPGDIIFPDIESLCVHLGINRKRLMVYAQRSPEWEETIEQVKEVIVAAKKQLISRGRINPVFGIFDLVNNTDYRSTNMFLQVAQEPKDKLPDIANVLKKLPNNDDTEEPTPQIEDKETLLKSLDEYLT